MVRALVGLRIIQKKMLGHRSGSDWVGLQIICEQILFSNENNIWSANLATTANLFQAWLVADIICRIANKCLITLKDLVLAGLGCGLDCQAELTEWGVVRLLASITLIPFVLNILDLFLIIIKSLFNHR